MTRTRGFLLLILAVLVAVWVTSSATTPAGRVPDGETAPSSSVRDAPSAFELEAVMRRLQDRLAAAEAAAPPAARNPFRFASEVRASPEPAPARPEGPAVPAPEVPAAPAMSLIGIVDRTVDGKPVRVGVVSLADGLHYVSVGDRVGTRYEVVAVDAEAIELKDTTDGSTRRVALR